MDIYERIRRNILDGDAEEVSELIEKAIKLKYPPKCILEEGLVAGINILAEKFRDEMVLIPEAIIASRALNAGLKTLNPYLRESKIYKGKAIIGTVEGDVHDIGKNIAKTMAATTGLEIKDLGVDVSSEQFIQAIKEYKPDIVMISALLTTTLRQMKAVIKAIEDNNLRKDVVIFVGGYPVIEQYANEIGADYYTQSANELRQLLEKNIDKILKQCRAKKSTKENK